MNFLRTNSVMKESMETLTNINYTFVCTILIIIYREKSNFNANYYFVFVVQMSTMLYCCSEKNRI